MNNYSVVEDCRNKLSSFGSNDLQTLLGAFGQSKRGGITELKDRAFGFLRTRPAYIPLQAIIAKIDEIHRSSQHGMPSNDIMMRSALQNQQQQIQMIDTNINLTMNNYSVVEDCRNKLSSFGSNDLQTLLGAFGQSKRGGITELKDRAFGFLRTRPAYIPLQAIIAKIDEIHRSSQHGMPSNDIMMRSALQNQQQQIQMIDTNINLTMNNYSVVEDCRNKLSSFGSNDLQTLLGAFGQSKRGGITELKDRAFGFLRTRPAYIPLQAIIAKIDEIHRSSQHGMPSNDIMMRSALQNQQQQIQMIDTNINLTMNNYSVVEDCRNKLSSFGSNDLQTLLGAFGQSKRGGITELKDRAFGFLRTRPAYIPLQAIIAKIDEIHRSSQHGMPSNDIMMRSALQNQQQQIQMIDTNINLTMNNYSVVEDCRNKLSSFGSNDLQTLLGAFGQSKRGGITELKDRAFGFLRTRPAYIPLQAIIAKIDEIHRSSQHGMPSNDIMMRSALQNQQQQIQMIDTNINLTMNNYSVVEDCRNKLSSFGSNDLQTLLGAFGQSKRGGITELKDRAFGFLRTRPAYIPLQAIIAKIDEIHRSSQHGMPSNDIMMRSALQNQQQQQIQMRTSMGHIQRAQAGLRQVMPRMQRVILQNRPPQFPRQSMHITRAGLSQVMPRMQRVIIQNQPQRMYQPPQCPAGNYQRSGNRIIVSHQLPPKEQLSIVAQDALGLGTRASGNSSCTPATETVAQIKFKKLPFYEVVDEVIKPTLLTGTDKCTLQDVPRGMKEASFQFNLSPEHCNLVATNLDTSHGKNEYHNQFQIRICQLIEPVPNESLDYMPLELHIRAGMKACPLPPTAPTRPGTKPRRTARPINCTEHVKLSPIVTNNITINWKPDGKKYVFAMYLVKKLTVDTLLKKIQDKGGRSLEDTKNYIIKKLADVDTDLASTSLTVSLLCPLGKMRIKIPVKSVHCDHLQCFDASTFMLMNEQKPTWMCPTCDKPSLYDDLQLENYFLEVVSSPILEDCSDEIELLADGTWRVLKDTKNTNIVEYRKLVKNLDCENLEKNKNEEPPIKRIKQETDAIQPVEEVDLNPQAQVQPQQAGTSSEQGVVIEID